LKDHEIAKLHNDLRDIAKKYHAHQCLRELIVQRLDMHGIIKRIKGEYINRIKKEGDK
jgi:hypothetical protein